MGPKDSSQAQLMIFFEEYRGLTGNSARWRGKQLSASGQLVDFAVSLSGHTYRLKNVICNYSQR